MGQDITFDIIARDHASSTFTKAGDSAHAANGHFSSLSGVLKGLVGGFLGLEAAEKATEFLGDSVKAAMADQQANAVLARQLHNTAHATDEQSKAVEEWLIKSSEATGIARDQLTPAFTKLVTATHSVSGAQKLMAIATNVSAGTHKSLTAITDALVRAQNGNIGGLSRLGVKTKDIHGKTLSFAAVQKNLAKQFRGDAAAAADTAGGRFKRLGVTFEEMKVSIGEKLLPILSTVTGFLLNKAGPAFAQVGGWIEQHLVPPLTSMGNFIADKVVPAFQHFGTESSRTGGLLSQFGQNVSSIFNSVKSIFSSLETFAIAFWNRYGDLIEKYGIGTLHALLSAVRGVMNVITGIFKTVAAVLHGDWKGAWDGIKQILGGAVQVLVGLVSNLWNLLKLAFQAGGRLLQNVMGLAWDGIKNLVGAGVGAVVNLVRGLGSKVGSVAVGLFDGIKNAFRAAINFIIDGWNSLSFKMPSIDTHIPGVGKIGGFTIGVPKIPHLAQGGIVKARPGGMLALIGEGGRDEAVVPLPRGGGGGLGGGSNGMLAAIRSELELLRRDMGSQYAVIEIDGETIVRAIRRRNHVVGVATAGI